MKRMQNIEEQDFLTYYFYQEIHIHFLLNKLMTLGQTSYTFVPAVSNATDLPYRITYPIVIQNINGANRQAAVSGLSDGDTIFSKLFWDNN